VIVTGGCTASCKSHDVTASSDVYDVNSGYWFTGDLVMSQARFGATATLLRNGTLLVVAGSNYCCQSYNTAETFSVPVLTDTPTSGPVGQQVELHGSGFFAFETVRVSWDGASLANVRTTRDGTFTVDVTVPSATAGKHTILASGKSSLVRAQATFTVTASG
jgi:hypothetical protein